MPGHMSLEEEQSLGELCLPPAGAALHSLDQILVLTLILTNGLALLESEVGPHSLPPINSSFWKQQCLANKAESSGCKLCQCDVGQLFNLTIAQCLCLKNEAHHVHLIG